MTTSKRIPIKLESGRGKEWYNGIFQNFLNVKNIQHYSSFTDKGQSIAELVIRTVRSLLKIQYLEKEMKNCFNWVNLRAMYSTEINSKNAKVDYRLNLLQQMKANYFIKLIDQEGFNENIH